MDFQSFGVELSCEGAVINLMKNLCKSSTRGCILLRNLKQINPGKGEQKNLGIHRTEGNWKTWSKTDKNGPGKLDRKRVISCFYITTGSWSSG